jgi:hypothetical protein
LSDLESNYSPTPHYQRAEAQTNMPSDRPPGHTKRYLPEKAWASLSQEERAKTDAKKKAGSKQGKQFVPNTEAAKKARQES